MTRRQRDQGGSSDALLLDDHQKPAVLGFHDVPILTFHIPILQRIALFAHGQPAAAAPSKKKQKLVLLTSDSCRALLKFAHTCSVWREVIMEPRFGEPVWRQVLRADPFQDELVGVACRNGLIDIVRSLVACCGLDRRLRDMDLVSLSAFSGCPTTLAFTLELTKQHPKQHKQPTAGARAVDDIPCRKLCRAICECCGSDRVPRSNSSSSSCCGEDGDDDATAKLDGFKQCIRLLVGAGAPVDPIDVGTDGALHAACRSGRSIELIRHLLEDYEANVNSVCGNAKQTPLHRFLSAPQNDDTITININSNNNKKKKQDDELLRKRIFHSDPRRCELVEYMLRRAGATANVADADGCFPLHFAATVAAGGKGCVRCCRALIEIGQSQVDPVDDVDGFTPLLAAARDGNFAVVQLLIAKGANAAFAVKSETGIVGLRGPSDTLDALRYAIEARNKYCDDNKDDDGGSRNIVLMTKTDDAVAAGRPQLCSSADVIRLLLRNDVDPTVGRYGGTTVPYGTHKHGHLNVKTRVNSLAYAKRFHNKEAEELLQPYFVDKMKREIPL